MASASASTFTCPFMEPEMAKATTISYDKFQSPDGLKTIVDILQEYGFVIVTDILTAKEREEAEQLLYRDLLATIDHSTTYDHRLDKVIERVRSGKIHWPPASLPGIVTKGFLSTHGLPQGECAWKLRTNEKVRQIYAALHRDNDLVVGTDVVFFNTRQEPAKAVKLWPHADQDIDLHDGCPDSYQGILYVYGATEPDQSNTILLPRSWNREYNELKAASHSTGKHEFKIESVPNAVKREQLMNRFKEGARRIQVPAGGLLIFNSRTIHQGYPSGLRFAQPISWEPRKYMNDGARLRKLQAIYTGIATTHWGARGEHHGASFLSARSPKYSDYEADCIFPMKAITPWPLLHRSKTNVKSLTMQQLLNLIKPEYLPYI